MSKKTMKDYFPKIKPINSRVNKIINNSERKKLEKVDMMIKSIRFHNPMETFMNICDKGKIKEISNINRKNKRQFISEKSMDLHGMTKNEAFEKLKLFFIRSQIANIQNVTIITGGSNTRDSILRNMFLQWIKNDFSMQISAYSEARSNDGGEGAFYLKLKKSKK